MVMDGKKNIKVLFMKSFSNLIRLNNAEIWKNSRIWGSIKILDIFYSAFLLFFKEQFFHCC